jgi:predicted deacylase
MLVAQHLLARLNELDALGQIRGQVSVLPFANPVGLSQHLHGHLSGRYDFGGTGNFNRDFPCLASTVLPALRKCLGHDPSVNTALIRQALLRAAANLNPRREAESLKANLLAQSIDADYVLDLHCDGQSLLHLYASSHHEANARALTTDLGARLLLLETQPGGSPFDDANAAPWWHLREALPAHPFPLGCFAATVELRGRDDVDDSLAAEDATGILRFLHRQGLISGDFEDRVPQRAPVVTNLNAVDVAEAPATGIVVYRREPGDEVAEGEVLGEIVDPAATNPTTGRTPVLSRTRGLLFARQAERFVRRGEQLCKVAGPHALSHRRAGELLVD